MKKIKRQNERYLYAFLKVRYIRKIYGFERIMEIQLPYFRNVSVFVTKLNRSYNWNTYQKLISLKRPKNS